MRLVTRAGARPPRAGFGVHVRFACRPSKPAVTFLRLTAGIRTKPETPRRCTTEETTLLDIRKRIEKHIKNSYLKRVDAPVGVKPRLRCWMELNEG